MRFGFEQVRENPHSIPERRIARQIDPHGSVLQRQIDRLLRYGWVCIAAQAYDQPCLAALAAKMSLLKPTCRYGFYAYVFGYRFFGIFVPWGVVLFYYSKKDCFFRFSRPIDGL